MQRATTASMAGDADTERALNPDPLWPSEVHERLELLRLTMGYDVQRQFALEMSVNPPDWNKYEAGKLALPARIAFKLVHRWNVSLDWLYYGKDAGLALPLRHQLLTEYDKLRKSGSIKKA